MNVKSTYLFECRIKYFWWIIMYFRRIRELREDNDISQKEVANYLNITQQQYSLYESGKRTIPVDFIIMLTRYYNVTSDYILGLSKEPKNN